MNTDKKIEILYDHYKDTFENQKIYLGKRNNYTLICLGLILVISFEISNPQQSISISNALIEKNIGVVKIDFSYINSVLIFILFWVVKMYYNHIFLIEKTYDYIHKIEKKLSQELNPFKITREGKTYLNHYPWLSNVVDKIYTVGFPLSVIFVAISKWKALINSMPEPIKNGHFWFDTVFLFGIVLSSLLYLANRHFNDFK